jgi:small subunit ribosomal protein S16
MPTRIRLQRKGKKGQPFYHLVVADGRAPRDGKFIERLGTYNPMTHPATIEIDFDRTLYWVQVGAQPSDTARSILANQGVMLKHHLIKGIAKGALTEEQVEERFQAWKDDKKAKLEQLSKDKELSKKELHKKRLEEERKINEAREQEHAKKRAKDNMKDAKAAEEVTEEAAEEVTEAAAEVTEVAAEVTEEAATEVTEVAAEAPAEETAPEAPESPEAEAPEQKKQEPAAE